LAPDQGQPPERFHLISMPQFSPDRNLIEHVWKDGKENIANTQRPTFEDRIHSRLFDY